MRWKRRESEGEEKADDDVEGGEEGEDVIGCLYACIGWVELVLARQRTNVGRHGEELVVKIRSKSCERCRFS